MPPDDQCRREPAEGLDLRIVAHAHEEQPELLRQLGLARRTDALRAQMVVLAVQRRGARHRSIALRDEPDAHWPRDNGGSVEDVPGTDDRVDVHVSRFQELPRDPTALVPLIDGI